MKLIETNGNVVELDYTKESFESCQQHVGGFIETLSVPTHFVMLLDEDASLKSVEPNFAATTLLRSFSDRSETLLGPVVVLESQEEIDAVLGG